MDERWQRIHADPEFRELERRRGFVARGLSALVLAAYYGFILVVAFAPALLARPLVAGSAITWGISAGVALIVLSFALTAVYVHYANTRVDPVLRTLLARHGSTGSGA